MKRPSVFKRLAIALLATTVLLTACGKRTEEVDSAASAPQFGSNGEILNGPPDLGAAVAESLTVRISSDRNFIPTGGDAVALITVYVTNDRNQAVADQEVEISADGGILQGISATTNVNGEATAILGLARDYRNSDIEVTAQIGRAVDTVLIQATGTTLEVLGADQTVAGEDVPLTVRLSAGSGNPIANREVSLTSAAGHTLSPATAVTDSAGEISLTVADVRADDEISLSAFDGSVTTTHRLALIDPLDPANQLSVRLASDSSVIPTGGDDVATVTAYVTNSRNQAVAGQAVEWVSDGGVLQSVSAVSDENGKATAVLDLAGDYRNRTVTVTATSGSASGRIAVQAAGTRIALSGPDAVEAGADAPVSILLTAGNGEPIANQPLRYASRTGNTIVTRSTVTDTAGAALLTVSGVRIDDEIRVTAFDGSVVATHRLSLIDEQDQSSPFKVRISSDRSVLPTGTDEVAKLTVYVTNANNQAVASQKVEITADAGVLQSIAGATDEQGEATATLSLARDYRNRDITVTARVGTASGTLVLQSAGTRLDVDGPASVVAGDTARLLVTLRDGSNASIANRPLQFRSQAGNTITPASASTDVNGQVALSVATDRGSDTVSVSAFDGTVTGQLAFSVVDSVDQIVPLNVRLISDRSFIATGSGDLATLRALVTNDRNQAVEGQTVEFRASGGVLRDMATQTDQNGEATATLGLASEFQNRAIAVTVSADGVEKSVLVQASGSRIQIAGPTALVTGNTARLVATLSDGNDEPIANTELSFSSSGGNVITPDTAMTDSAGRVAVEMTTSNGDDTLFASALDGTVVGSHSFTVASDLLSFAAGLDGAELEVGRVHPVSVVWESQGQPVDSQPLRFGITTGRITDTGSALVTDQATTDSDGVATVNVSSTSAGPATITVEALNGGDPATQIGVEFVARQAASVTLESSNSRVQTGSQSTLTARVTDVSGNPVKGSVVRFASDDLRGGTLTPASATTDSAGMARVIFTAGGLATEVDAIAVSAAVEGAGATGDTLLTVVDRQLNVTLGTSTEIRSAGGDTQYQVPFVVQVADGSGAPLSDATVDVSLHPLAYFKGEMVLADKAGRTDSTLLGFDPDHWAQMLASAADQGCASEDIDSDRQIDPNEDVNNNGVLDPQDPALVVITSTTSGATGPSSLKTDQRGSGYFDLIYPQSNALWATVEVTARARAFNAESIATFITTLPLPAAESKDVQTGPPNQFSPYGVTGGCDVAGSE